MSASRNPLFFYQFLGAHSLLIGLLPFFLPVYLWTQGLNLAGLCILVGISGLSFCAALRLWQSLASRCTLRSMIGITFALEISLVFIVGLFTTIPGAALHQLASVSAPGVSASATASVSAAIVFAAVIIGAASGAYNAFFWTTQRTLFLQQLGRNDTGRQYGNLQIFVSLFLKLGILLGGFLLDHGGFVWLLAISAGTCALSGSYLCAASESQKRLNPDNECVTLWHSLRFTDQQGSKNMFRIDGIFLYLESHFWTLSLFLVVQQDFSSLGIAVVVLALVFAALFFVIKNRIDQLSISLVFKTAVWLYAASWIMRLGLNEQSGGASLLVILIMITFCSSFFRLAFNKRFFDVACNTQSLNYLLMKSHVSQWILGLFFLALGAVLWASDMDTAIVLSGVYAGAAIVSLAYLGYARTESRGT